MAKRKYIYFCEVERFGYTLQVIELTEEAARQAIINEYVSTYIKINGFDPRIKEKFPSYEDDENNDFEVFINELNIEKRELGKVEWT